MILRPCISYLSVMAEEVLQRYGSQFLTTGTIIVATGCNGGDAEEEMKP